MKAKVTNMIEAGAKFQRNMFSEIKIPIECNTDREEMSKFAVLSGCTYNDEICFVGIAPKFIICHLVKDISETVTKFLRERSVSAGDKYMNTWVSSTNK